MILPLNASNFTGSIIMETAKVSENRPK
jgi:hypothetical protein